MIFYTRYLFSEQTLPSQIRLNLQFGVEWCNYEQVDFQNLILERHTFEIGLS